MNIQLKSLRERGMAHIILPALVIVAIAVVGSVVLLKTHAQAPAAIKGPMILATVTATNADNNKSLGLYLGQQLDVKLDNSVWSIGSSSNADVLKYISKSTSGPTKTYPSGTVTAIYKTLSTGKATVVASLITRPVCKAGVMCPQYISVSSFRVTVTVAPEPRCPDVTTGEYICE